MYHSSFVLPNQKEWDSFYEKCNIAQNYNIACVGPRESCKTTLLQYVVQKHLEKYPSISKDKIILPFYFNDDNKFNNIITFCKNNVNVDKLVIIEYFDDLNDSGQQYLKSIIDTFHYNKKSNKVHFLIESSSMYKIKDFIKVRLQLFHTQRLDYKCFKHIFISLCERYNMEYHDSCFSYIQRKQSLTLCSLINFFEKLKRLKITHIKYATFHDLYHHLDESIFMSYFSFIEDNDIREANKLLFDLYDDGYDVSDILFFLYEYVKQHKQQHYAIEFICKYLNEYYNGHNHKIFIVFLTNDIKNKKNN